ncbi:MAG: hypothetical protein LBT46_13890 [Planctomycetaceae bacterium]|jgi:WD40 repeat protein|nr:hypothetical protein [Planctomycetaceae bacterium]
MKTITASLTVILSALLLTTAYCVPTASAAPPAIVLKGHTGNINLADLSPDGKKVIAASEDKTARIWDMETINSGGKSGTGRTVRRTAD